MWAYNNHLGCGHHFNLGTVTLSVLYTTLTFSNHMQPIIMLGNITKCPELMNEEPGRFLKT